MDLQMRIIYGFEIKRGSCMKYDGLIFGNGMSLNLLQQLKSFIPLQKQYLLDIDDFLKQWIEGKITRREETIFYTAIYGNRKDKWSFFELLKDKMAIYYEKYNADIEYTLGTLLFEESGYKEVILFFPVIYNVWYIILYEYLEYLNLKSKITKFYESVKWITGSPHYVWTTNFDLLGESINPTHVHGRFLTKIRGYEDVVYKMINNGENYYFKYIWGHNGIGKLNNINQLMKFADYTDFFDFDFFFDNNIKMDKMLIYGMGFREAGYINDLRGAYSQYDKATFGAIIDEHILMRINGMQNLGILNQVDITYFNDEEKSYLEEVMEATMIKKYCLIKT